MRTATPGLGMFIHLVRPGLIAEQRAANLWGPPGKGRLRSKLLFLTSLHIEFVRGVGVTTAFSGCLIELDGFAGATLGTDNFIRVNKPS